MWKRDKALALIVGGFALLVLAFLVAVPRFRAASPQARAREAGATFLAAAARGDEAAVLSLLAEGATITAAEAVGQYLGLMDTDAFDVKRALANQNGVQFIVLASGVDRAGRPHSTMLAMVRQNDTWLVLKAGDGFAY
jgi:hypothetical protein